MISGKKLFLPQVLIIFIFTVAPVNSQTCGFGCLGLSGVYAGYTWQNYDASGLNRYLETVIQTKYPGTSVDLNRGRGFRVGVNIFRAKFEDYFISVKGFYQFLKETESFSDSRQEGLVSNNIEFIMNHWGLGVDFGIPVFNFLDIKVLEGGVTIFNIELKDEGELNGQRSELREYSNDKTELGYFAGTGLILHIVRDYVSLEGTASYSFFNIDKLRSGSGEVIPGDNSNSSMIKNSGITMSVQINLGIPL